MDSTPNLTQPQSVYDRLRSWILDGSLASGQRLPIRDIARGMSVSTMPVREALVRLADTGLVSHEPHKGAVVSQLSVDHLNEFYNLRRLIEPPTIQTGIERMTPERIQRMHSVMKNLNKALAEGNVVATLDLDEDLLSIIHGAVANKQIARVIKDTWVRVRPYKLLFTTVAQDDIGTYVTNECAGFIDAAERGDGRAAHDLMINGLDYGQLRLSDLLRSYQSGELEPRSTVPIANGESLAAVIAKLSDLWVYNEATSPTEPARH